MAHKKVSEVHAYVHIENELANNAYSGEIVH